jgi:hypothetical protein
VCRRSYPARALRKCTFTLELGTTPRIHDVNDVLTDLQVPYVLYVSLFMICAGLTLPRTSRACNFNTQQSLFRLAFSDLSLQYYFLLWLSAVVLCSVFILVHGIFYVTWPRLAPLSDLIEYDGPGVFTTKRGRGIVLNGHRKATHLRSRFTPFEKESITRKRID